MGRLLIVAAAALALLAAPARAEFGGAASRAALPLGVPAHAVPATVAGYFTGDEFAVVFLGKPDKVELIGDSAPRLGSGPAGTGAECYARAAVDHLKQVLPLHTLIYLEAEPSFSDDRDAEGFLIRYAWVPGRNGAPASLLNATLLAEGYASLNTNLPETKYFTVLEAAESRAQATKAGLWGACGGGHVPLRPPGSPAAMTGPPGGD